MSISARLLNKLPRPLSDALWIRSLPAALRDLLPLPPAVEEEIRRINRVGNVLPGGWCPLDKQRILAALVVGHGLQRAVEIGVFQGGSLLPLASAMRATGGHVFGIDPYSPAAAEQRENLERFVPLVGSDWHARIDWEGLYERVGRLIAREGLSPYVTLLRETSDAAAPRIAPPLDLLHIDGNHDSDAVASDVANWIPKVRSGGFIVVDDTHWDGVHAHYSRLRAAMPPLFESFGSGSGRPEWAVLVKP